MTEKKQEDQKTERIPEAERIPVVDPVTLTKLAMSLPPDETRGKSYRDCVEIVYRKILIAQDVTKKIEKMSKPISIGFFVNGISLDAAYTLDSLKTLTFDEAAKGLFSDKPAKRFEELVRRTYPEGWTYQPLGRPAIHTPVDKLIEQFKKIGIAQSQFDGLKKRRDEERATRGRMNRLKGLSEKKAPRK